MSPDGKHVPLSLPQEQALKLVSELRARGVVQARMKTDSFELDVVIQPDLAPQNQLTEEQRQLLINSPETPEAMKARLREEYERDLYASS